MSNGVQRPPYPDAQSAARALPTDGARPSVEEAQNAAARVHVKPGQKVFAVMYVDSSGSMINKVPPFNMCFEALATVLVDHEDSPGPDKSKLALFSGDREVKVQLEGHLTESNKLLAWLPTYPQKIGGSSRIWQSIHDDLVKVHARLAGESWQIVAYVLTDGEDNGSEGAFRGYRGAIAMVDELAKKNIKVILNAVPFGDGHSNEAIDALTKAAEQCGGRCVEVKDITQNVEQFAAATKKMKEAVTPTRSKIFNVSIEGQPPSPIRVYENTPRRELIECIYDDVGLPTEEARRYKICDASPWSPRDGMSVAISYAGLRDGTTLAMVRKSPQQMLELNAMPQAYGMPQMAIRPPIGDPSYQGGVAYGQPVAPGYEQTGMPQVQWAPMGGGAQQFSAHAFSGSWHGRP